MKSLLFTILIASISAHAETCENFSGKYMDEENVRIEIKQIQCQTISFISNGKTSELNLDGKSRLHETGDKQVSYVAAQMKQKTLILEQIIQDKVPVRTGYIYKMILTYKFEDPETLVEDTKLYNNADKLIDYKTMNLLRIRQ